jgi:Flp pilus assembly protein TadG
MTGGAWKRRGAAVVEFAVVTPLLVSILFGIIEYGYIFFARSTIQHAAREACRIAILQTSESPYSEVTDRIVDLMGTASISSYTVNMTHATEEEPYETVTITVPFDAVSLLGGYFPHPSSGIQGTCSMRKEGL